MLQGLTVPSPAGRLAPPGMIHPRGAPAERGAEHVEAHRRRPAAARAPTQDHGHRRAGCRCPHGEADFHALHAAHGKVYVRDGRETLYVAASDRGILASTDQGRTFTTRYSE